jgi:hypothetical protein
MFLAGSGSPSGRTSSQPEASVGLSRLSLADAHAERRERGVIAASLRVPAHHEPAHLTTTGPGEPGRMTTFTT